MGRYTDPKIILDKRFEAVSKGLETLYTNVGNNIKAIQARAQKKKALQDKIIKDYGKMYLTNTQESFNKALNWAESNKNAFEKDNKFVTDIQNIYKGGLEDIVDFIKTGADETEILALVNERSNDANKLTKGIVGFSNISATNNDGLKNIAAQPGKIKGNKTGDVVIGSDNAGIFAATGTQVGQEIPFSELRVVGKLSTGVSLFYDRDGNETADKKREITTDEGEVEVQESEILDLFKLGENYESGNTDAYFGTIEDITDIVKENSTQLKNLGKDAAFTREVMYTSEDGQQTKATYIDEKKRQDYFLDESTPGGKLINNIIASKDLTMLAQLVGGIDFANKADFANNPAEMELLKVGLIDKLIPSLFPGSEKLGPSSFGGKSTSMQFEDRDPAIETITNFTVPIHETILDYAETDMNSGDVSKLQKYKGRPYRQGSDATDRGLVDSIIVPDSDEPTKIQVKYVANNGNVEVGTVIDMATNEGRALFEANLVNGNFPRAKRARIFGIGEAVVGGYEYNDSKTTTRVTNRKGISAMSQDEFNAMKSESGDVLKFDNLYDQWYDETFGNQNNQQQSGGGSASAVQSQNNQQEEEEQEEVAVNNVTDLSINNFGGVDYSSNDLGGVDPVQYANDGSAQDQYRIILNFENTAGSSDGTHLDNYGFTGAAYEGRRPKTPEEALKIINDEIVPEVVKEIGIDKNDFESLPANVQGALVDYKFNTGRSDKDVLQIAYNKAMGISGGWDAVKSYGIDANGDKITEKLDYKKDEVVKALKEGKITPEIIAEVKDEQYLARIQGMRNMLKKDPNATNSQGVPIKQLLTQAEKAYLKSHSSRVKMFI